MPIGPARLYHVNANCSDLDRSLAFYEGLGLQRTVRTTVEAQACGALGLEVGAWDAWILRGARRHGEGAVLDLLEWQTPAPVGVPADRDDLGYTTLVFESPSAPPGPSVDPDGTSVEIRRGEEPRFAAVKLGVRDVERSAAWWSDVVGLRAENGVVTDDRGTGAFAVELVPGGPGAAPPPSTANRLGLYRMALQTKSIEDDHRFLLDRGVPCLSGVERLVMGGDLPELQVLCFLDPDGTVVELIESPIEAVATGPR